MKKQVIKNRQGEDRFRFTLTEREYQDLDSESGGFCIRCGEEAFGVEPDARKYECECCGEAGVYGAEELVLRGFIVFAPAKEAEAED